MPQQDLKWALDEFRSLRIASYRLCHRYYDGDHRMAFATGKYIGAFGRLFQSLSDNLCAPVIDIPTERLELVGFTTDKATTSTKQAADRTFAVKEDPLGASAWDLWEKLAMPIFADEVHRESLRCGDGYIIMDTDDEGQPQLWPQDARRMACAYSTSKQGSIEIAAKHWFVPDGSDPRYKRLRVNLYYSDHCEKYVTSNRVTAFAQSLTPRSFEPFEDGEYASPGGQMAVYHFPNRAAGSYGRSELLAVIPIQDVLNKEIADMLVASEFQAFRQRWVTGLEVEVDEATGKPKAPPFNVGADRILAAPSADAKFGEFGQLELDGFLNAQERTRAQIARLAGIPLHYFYLAGDREPTGEALKTGETRFARKMAKAQSRYGKQWEEIIKAALTVAGEDVPEDIDFNAEWLSTDPRSDSERMDVQLKKKNLGVSTSKGLRELGYDDDEIVQMLEENASAAPDSGEAADRSAADRAALDRIVPPQEQERNKPPGAERP